MQIARSKQEKIQKMVMKELPPDSEPPKLSKKDKDRKESLALKEDSQLVPEKMLCSGCDFEICRANSSDNYYSECKECGSKFCR